MLRNILFDMIKHITRNEKEVEKTLQDNKEVYLTFINKEKLKGKRIVVSIKMKDYIDG